MNVSISTEISIRMATEAPLMNQRLPQGLSTDGDEWPEGWQMIVPVT